MLVEYLSYYHLGDQYDILNIMIVMLNLDLKQHDKLL